MAIELDDISVGKVDFIEKHDLWTDEQKKAAEKVISLVKEGNFRTVRVSWPDQHGILRGKTLTANAFLHALRNGQDFQSAVLIMDTANRIIFPLFRTGGGFGIPEMTGYPDMILVPDPLSFRELPWAPGTGWCLSDAYFQNGKPVPFSSRYVLRQWLKKLAEHGYEYVSGLEVEWYITKLEDPMLLPEQSGWPPEPPKVSAIAHGFQYLTEMRQDEIDEILSVLERQLQEVGLPLRTMEDEWGPGQCEFTFDPRKGMESADNMVLFRTAAKQICRRNGYHATFMCRPNLENFFSSGWHLHESLRGIGTQQNAFTSREGGEWGTGEWLSDVGKYFVGGLLEHAAAQCVFSTPTINGYKRFRPESFAPDKITWALENRAAYIRVVSAGPGDEAAHIGEPLPVHGVADHCRAGRYPKQDRPRTNGRGALHRGQAPTPPKPHGRDGGPEGGRRVQRGAREAFHGVHNRVQAVGDRRLPRLRDRGGRGRPGGPSHHRDPLGAQGVLRGLLIRGA